jgi:hypothetical protein
VLRAVRPGSAVLKSSALVVVKVEQCWPE